MTEKQTKQYYDGPRKFNQWPNTTKSLSVMTEKLKITQQDIEWIQRMQKQHGLPDSAVNYNQPWVDKAYQASVDAAS